MRFSSATVVGDAEKRAGEVTVGTAGIGESGVLFTPKCCKPKIIPRVLEVKSEALHDNVIYL